MGPILIFDKSLLESLTLDESVWLDNFFLSNITPIFYVETLADLEKEGKKGKVVRTGDELVRELANKTPLLEPCPNVHHQRLVLGDLLGYPVEMSVYHRPIVSGGDYKVNPNGKLAIEFNDFPEQAALARWTRCEFREIEREVANGWRQALSKSNFDLKINLIKHEFSNDYHFSDVEDVKKHVDNVINSKYHQFIYLALDLLDVPEAIRRDVLARWSSTRPLPFKEFAPYAAYVLSVNLFFYLCLDKSFISKDRHSNLIDLAYLYYLPFCMVFASGDNLHKRIVPLFMGIEQTFVSGRELKEDLHKLIEYYTKLPSEVKALGMMKYAVYPPDDFDTLIGRLFDKHLAPSWRENAKKVKEELFKPLDPEGKFLKQLKQKQEGQKPYIGPPILSDQAESMIIKRMVPVKRGNWRILPEGIENRQSNID